MKPVKDLYNKKYKLLKKLMDEDFRRWKTSHAHGSAE
jgi:hypothetical protein